MKKLSALFTLVVATFLVGCGSSLTDLKGGVEYNNNIITLLDQSDVIYQEYTDASASENLETVDAISVAEEVRLTTIAQLQASLETLKALEDFNGDASLKDAAVAYVQDSISVLETEEKEYLDVYKTFLASEETDADAADQLSKIGEAIYERHEAILEAFTSTQETFAAKHGYLLEEQPEME